MLARQLRCKQTDAERALWSRLRNRRLNGAKFRRQHPIGRYIADFCCPEFLLVVELDGGHHADESGTDQQRTDALVHDGYRVIRFWNHEVLTDIETVLQVINAALKTPSPTPSPLVGRGKTIKTAAVRSAR